MTYSIQRTTATGAYQVLSTPPYIDQSHIKVYIDNVLTGAYVWVTSNTIGITATAGTEIKIQRLTSPGERLVDYQSGNTLTEGDLDTDSLQAFYLFQEAADLYLDLVTTGEVIDPTNYGLMGVQLIATNTAAEVRALIATAIGASIMAGDDAAEIRTLLGLASIFVAKAGDSMTGALSVAASAHTPPVAIAFANPFSIDAALSNVFTVGALTANTVITAITNPHDGQTINVRFVQDGVGSRTVTLASNMKISGAIQAAASSASWLIATYSAISGNWEGAWSSVPA
jgi:hypothetical protein